MNKIIHVYVDYNNNKFVPAMAELLSNNDTGAEHVYIVIGNSRLEGGIKVSELNNNFLDAIKSILIVRREKPSAIIFHSLPRRFYKLIYLIPLIVNTKKYLVVWGGEINHIAYDNNLRQRISRLINKMFIRQMDGYVSGLESDYLKISKVFGGNGTWINLPALYPSNIIANVKYKQRCNIKNIMIGASNLKRNMHLDVINKLASMPVPEDVLYHFPFSYGDASESYKNMVKQLAAEKLNDQVIFYDAFMPFDDYLLFLRKMDCAFFISEEQQGLGNINQLIASGAQVFVRKNSDIDKFFRSLDIVLFDFVDFCYRIPDPEILFSNHKKISAHQSLEASILKMKDFFVQHK